MTEKLTSEEIVKSCGFIVDEAQEYDQKEYEKFFYEVMSVLGSTQVDLLGDFAKGERSSSGFIDRILFVFPKNLEKKY